VVDALKAHSYIIGPVSPRIIHLMPCSEMLQGISVGNSPSGYVCDLKIESIK